jgi:hypothetical protein
MIYKVYTVHTIHTVIFKYDLQGIYWISFSSNLIMILEKTTIYDIQVYWQASK